MLRRLWDLHGKLLQQPVYALLGGMTKKTIPVYATTVRPDLAAKLGFVGCKYPLAYGPDDGDDGFRRNVEIHKHWRERVGPEQPLMIDCCTPSPPQPPALCWRCPPVLPPSLASGPHFSDAALLRSCPPAGVPLIVAAVRHGARCAILDSAGAGTLSARPQVDGGVPHPGTHTPGHLQALPSPQPASLWPQPVALDLRPPCRATDASPGLWMLCRTTTQVTPRSTTRWRAFPRSSRQGSMSTRAMASSNSWRRVWTCCSPT